MLKKNVPSKTEQLDKSPEMLLREAGFRRRDHDMTTWKTNVGSWTVHTYFYVNENTGVELKLYRNAGLLDIPGLRWTLVAGDAKAKVALLALAAQISPDFAEGLR